MSRTKEATLDLSRVARLPPSPALDERVRRKALRILERTPARDRGRRWTSLLSRLVAHAAVAALSVSYLAWAVASAARLYR